jgi:glycolate oxidase FAD binding subunit
VPTTLAELQLICGEEYARVGGAVDTVSGVPVSWVAAPASAEAVGAVLELATGTGLTVVPSGGGTKLDWAAPPSRVDILVDTGRLAGMRHSPGDPAATMGAGTPVRAVQAALARSGQRLSIDPGSASATVGGVLAACEAGPLRLAYGIPEDLLISATVVRADGTIVSTGGEVTPSAAVRSPAPDLAKVLCGSYGTLGVITSVKMVVHPKPAVRSWVMYPVRSPLEMHDQLLTLLSGRLAPSAIEVDLPSEYGPGDAAPGQERAVKPGAGMLGVLLEGSQDDVAVRTRNALALLGTRASAMATAPWWWGVYPFGPGDVALRLTAPPLDLHAGVYSVRDATGAPVAVRGSAGAGVVYAALPGSLSPTRVASAIVAVHATLVARGGSCLVLSAPPSVRDAVNLWDMFPTPPRMRQAKEQLDPNHTLAPGRTPAGS